MTHAFPLPRFDLGLGEIAADYDLVLCDVWGVVHNGVSHYARAVDALLRFRAQGGAVVLVTNAPAPRAQVQARLDRLEVPREAYDAIATSGDVTVDVIVAAGCPPLFGIGPEEESCLYLEAARRGPKPPERVPLEAAQLAICIGLDATGDRPEDYDPLLRDMAARRLDLVCANPDIVVEMGDDLVFCAGAIAGRYAALGGNVIHAGKPYAAIYERAMAMGAAALGRPDSLSRERILAIGDAFHTDLAGARDQGIDSVLITTGIHRANLHRADLHRDGAIDARALEDLCAEHGVYPRAALPGLGWRATPAIET